jgi:hypothetical protein
MTAFLRQVEVVGGCKHAVWAVEQQEARKGSRGN